MSRSLKRILFIIGGAIGLLLLVAWVVPLVVDVNRFKPRLESAASAALGTDVRIGGRLSVRLLPSPRVIAEDGRVLGEQGDTLASARRTSFWVDLFPLLRGQLRVRRLELRQPVLSIERDAEGKTNVERLKQGKGFLRILDGSRVSVSDGSLRYSDQKSGATIEVTGLEVRASGKNGIFEFTPVTGQMFGGHMTGNLRADLSGAVPAYQLHLSLKRFRIEEFLKSHSHEKTVVGAMDFSMAQSMQGSTMKAMVETAAGELSLRGSDLTLVGSDLDLAISRFESSQGINLVDVGAVFLTGPLGLAATRSYTFANLFRGTGGNTTIATAVSDWKVEHGVAQAQDVALATTRNRIALQGGLDLVHERFAGVTMAVINEKGCATVQQEITGSFESPVVEKPHVLASLAGPLLKLYRQTRELLPGAPCQFSYSGSVAPPDQR